MTARRGSLWKSSWKRDRGGVGPPVLGRMAFFEHFSSGGGSAAYRSTLATTLGAALPFWFAVVSHSSGRFFAVDADSGWSAETGIGGVKGSAQLEGGDDETSLTISQGAISAGVSAAICWVQEAGTGRRLSMYLNKQIYRTVVGADAYVPPALVLNLVGDGSVHGACGGPGVPTQAQMSAWFNSLKATRQIGPIPGITTHLYSAAAVFPTVPATLVDLAGGQNLTLTTLFGVPTPVNVMQNVAFNY